MQNVQNDCLNSTELFQSQQDKKLFNVDLSRI